MVRRVVFRATYKAFFACLAIGALVTEVVTLIARGTFNPVNFFSFFTVESNMLAAAVLLLSAASLFMKRPPVWFGLLRGAATVYMILTGVVFAILLSGYDPTMLTAVPWDNTVLHYIMPAAVIVDWLIDPPARRIAFRQAGWWVLFPLLYLTYTLFRGANVGWYPYPFLNPSETGYGTVMVACSGVALVLFGIVTAVVFGSRRKNNAS